MIETRDEARAERLLKKHTAMIHELQEKMDKCQDPVEWEWLSDQFKKTSSLYRRQERALSALNPMDFEYIEVMEKFFKEHVK